MFGSKTRKYEIKILELERQLNEEIAKRSELEKQLAEEQIAHTTDQNELQELRETVDSEKNTFVELQDVLRQKVLQMNEKDKQRDEQLSVQLRQSEEKAAQMRVQMEVELGRLKDQEREALKTKVREISSTYCDYLSQLVKAIEYVSNTTIRVSDTYFDKDVNIAGLLHEQIKRSFADMPEDQGGPSEQSGSGGQGSSTEQDGPEGQGGFTEQGSPEEQGGSTDQGSPVKEESFILDREGAPGPEPNIN